MRRLVVAMLAAGIAAVAGCGGADGDADAPAQSAAGAAGAAGSAGKSGAGQAGTGGSSGAPASPATWADCQDSEQAWVRKAMVAALGRRPLGQAEVDLYVDLIAAVDALDGIGKTGPKPAPGAPLKRSRRAALEAMQRSTDALGNSEYIARWMDTYRDMLRVQRLDQQANPGCYSNAKRPDDPAVALLVRDQGPGSKGDGNGAFTMRDVITGSLALDDVTPIYIGNLLAFLQTTYDGANADEIKLELSRRTDFGAWFDGVYLHRDGVCLKCHNSQFSVTADEDPKKNRFYPVPGRLEAALFDSSAGNDEKALPGQTEYDGVTRAHALLRFGGFVDDKKATFKPWGWDVPCGTVVPKDQVSPDPAGVDAKFGNITGDRATAWDLVVSLQAGFRKLREHGLSRGPKGEIPDPDEAFAYLVAANIVEHVWKEIVGTPLTIANYFPRNAAARDELIELTEAFIASGFSHRRLLELVTESPAFNVLAPDAGCGEAPYGMPAIYDPWVIAEADPQKRGNSLGDGVAALSSRTLVRTTHRAMGWPTIPAAFFPPFGKPSDEAEFQSEIGLYLKSSEPGFRGFDFQARLAWEERFGACAAPPGNTGPDFVDALLAGASAGTAGDVVAALKDRLVGDPRVEPNVEKPLLEKMLGTSLASPGDSVNPAGLRRVCGVLLSSPQFLLGGVAPPDGTGVPLLTPAHARYGALCEGLAASGPLSSGLTLACGAKVTVSK